MGVEPTLPEENYALNVARLPIPPLRQKSNIKFRSILPLVNRIIKRGVVNIGYTAHTASMQPACDVSKCEHSLTPGKPFYATLSPVRVNNRKQQQSLAHVRMSQKRLMLQKAFLRHKSHTIIAFAAIETACLIYRKQADTGVSRCIPMRSRDSRRCDRRNLHGDTRGTIGALSGHSEGFCEGFASTIFTIPIKRRSLSAKMASCYNAPR